MRNLAFILTLVPALLLAATGCVRVKVGGRPRIQPDAAQAETMAQLAREVRILRDEWGVPHVFGNTDAATAFGLAYAHAQDDWPMIQGSLAAARGQLSLLTLSRQALGNDFFADLFEIRRRAAEQLQAVSPDFRTVLDGYAAGLNLYASRHPEEADARLYPYGAADVLAGFLHKLTLFIGVGDALAALDGGAPAVGELPVHAPGSNAHAVHRSRSPDDVTRLNINSHQPWEGPVAWYEAHLVSKEGWNMTGALFPGAPVVLHGHNEHIGWAHTVNRPDLVDVFKLVVTRGSRTSGDTYRMDGTERPLARVPITIDIALPGLVVSVDRDGFASEHGPVMPSKGDFYAIRAAGLERAGLAAEQWYRMNKARDRREWDAALRMQALSMFNIVSADRDTVDYVYYGLIPERHGAYDYRRVLPGDRSDALWGAYLNYDRLPRVTNPPSGFVQNCNSTPFATTTGEGNPDPAAYPPALGIERQLTNRARRSLALFGSDAAIDRDTFRRYKWDRTYAPDSELYTDFIVPLLARPAATFGSDDERRAVELLRAWNGEADESQPGAAVAVLAAHLLYEVDGTLRAPYAQDPTRALTDAVAFLKESFRRVDVPLGELQRLRRGAVDLPVGGAPDTLNATHAEMRDGRLVGVQGDSYVLLVDFAKDGTRSWAVHQYGNVNRPASPHYADQAPLFVRRELRPSLRTEAEIRARLAAEYHPGEE